MLKLKTSIAINLKLIIVGWLMFFGQVCLGQNQRYDADLMVGFRKHLEQPYSKFLSVGVYKPFKIAGIQTYVSPFVNISSNLLLYSLCTGIEVTLLMPLLKR